MDLTTLTETLLRAELVEDPTHLDALAEAHPADLADALETLEPAHGARVIVALPEPLRGAVFGYLERDSQAHLIAHLDDDGLVAIFEDMEADERVDVYLRLPEDRQPAVLAAISKPQRREIEVLAAFPEGTVGAIMTTEVAVLDRGLNVAEAMASLRRDAPNKETIYSAYIVDEARRLHGWVTLRDLILAEPTELLDEVMRTPPTTLRATDPREAAVRGIRDYDLIAVPVLDAGGVLIGLVTHDDAMDVAQAEATEDFLKVAGFDVGHGGHQAIGALGTQIKDASIAFLYRRRVVWLVLLVFGNIFSGAGLAFFEDTIASYVPLVFFLPLLIDSGGNAGAQAATLTVRALGTGELQIKDWGSMLGREVAVAALLGLTMAAAVSLLGLARGGPAIALVVASTMVSIVVVGSVIGASLPFLLSRLKLDPATASAPLITSIADATGVVLYFSIASTVLPMLDA
ncbi:MAG: magnesium transporter [Deltaproteobacteria bacterium]|nr:MAG: magnesium transporter [Deltaproteobacteria bacterium]